MTGTITRRGKHSYRLKYELQRNHITGERRTVYKTIKGTRKDAEKELRAILTDMDRGIQIDPSSITLGEYLDDWLTKTAPQTVGLKTSERYGGLVRNQIKPHLGNIPLQKLRPADVSGWMQKLIVSGDLSTRSIRHAHAVLRTALAHATAIEIVARNIATIIRPPKQERSKPVILTSDQVSETLQKLKGNSIYTVAVVAIGTGARRGEIAALRWSDIKLDARTMRIERGP